MARPRVHTDELRESLMTHALSAVEKDGIAGLSLRAIAQGAGTSTAAVYSLFGSKEALQRAVLVRAYEGFAEEQNQVEVTEDPVTDLAGLGAVYVQWALGHPRLYQLMFGESLVGVGPSAEVAGASQRAMRRLTDGVRRAVNNGDFRGADGDVPTIATSLWAQVHGLASLMLAGRLPDGVDVATAALATIEGWRTPGA